MAMELCIAKAIMSTIPRHDHALVSPTSMTSVTSTPSWKSSFSLSRSSIYRYNRGFLCTANSSLGSSTSEETSVGVSQYVKDEPDRVTAMEENQFLEKSELREDVENNVTKEDSSSDGQLRLTEFLDKFDIKLDSENSYSVLLFGGVALVALWLASAVVGAIDSVPLVPKFLEIVGLGYAVWFTSRYLLFKETRDELAVKVEEIKKDVLGSDGD